jgi:hypothetical protein
MVIEDGQDSVRSCRHIEVAPFTPHNDPLITTCRHFFGIF